MNAKKTVASVDEVLATIQNAADHPNTEPRMVPEGKVGHQGDVYVHPVEASHTHGEETSNMQVAFGDTKGSRHIVGGEGVKVYIGTTRPKGVATDIPVGPFIEAPNGFFLDHPDHPTHTYGPGCYQVTLQLDIHTMRAVLD